MRPPNRRPPCTACDGFGSDLRPEVPCRECGGSGLKKDMKSEKRKRSRRAREEAYRSCGMVKTAYGWE